ncbi:Poly(3-hydroxyalkanoate) depolymerase [Psilocybe cubensis]|uniref:Poly(3-hydroxyalkanoate) depolymerase n=2 Tax=Psilocybe cubensis TaxID=181762 RepID=A0ACB8H5Y0_PSICU|nr:Poly(3-hydroxyalkanoate) depolymerase [Psilocybe cubensis]KAH9483134.1 Poly(3-hydroxyalkanoate) depolymerase [Psilocybe cubensis]
MAPVGQSARPVTPSRPYLPTAFPKSTCLRRGLCPVTALRAQGPEALESHSLYYEVHGPKEVADSIQKAQPEEIQRNNPNNDEAFQEEMKKLDKVVFIMGLNSSSFSWGPQVRWFGKGGSGNSERKAAALVFDNRGVGNSGYPRGPYTTSGMAEDAICLLDYLGWTGERELNIVGISLGGMIAQELAYRIPHRIASLVLAVTTPGGHIWNNFPPMKGLTSLTKLMFTPEPIDKVPTVLDMLFPAKWLAERAQSDPHAEWNGNTEDNREGKTNRDVQQEGFLRRVAITQPQLFLGHISQMAAGLTHHVSPTRLAQIANTVPKIAIVTGDEDNLVRPIGSVKIWKAMTEGPGQNTAEVRKRVELLQWEGTGHGIHSQKEVEFNQLVERCMREGKALVEAGFTPRS